NCAGAGPICHAYSAGGARWNYSNYFGAGIIYCGGEIHEPWRAGNWRDCLDVAGRTDAGAFAADPRGCESRRGAGRDASVCGHRNFSDALGAEIAHLEALDGARTVRWKYC